MKEFNVNDYLSLKLENGLTVIYVKGKRFDQCKFLLLEIPIKEITPLADIESIDEAVEELDSSLEGSEGNYVKIPPEIEFWGHCSNLQAWYEYNYDTRLLHSNLSFPLLKKLVEVGDPLANKVFKEEIAKRFHSGYIPSIYYLIQENYLDYLDDDEINLIFLENNPKLKQQLKNIDKKLRNMPFYILLRFIDRGDKKAKEIIKNTEIYEINLSKSELTVLPEAIGNFTSLQTLNLKFNKLTKLPEAIGNLASLQELDLSENKLTKLPEAIGKLTSLQSLNLYNNQLSAFPEVIGNLSSLQSLNLSGNILRKLPETIGILTSLHKLDFGLNQLIELPEAIGNLTSLKKLYLDGNQLIELPKAIEKLISLQRLDLDKNQLRKLPEAIGNLRSLYELYLSYNKLKKLPEAIGNLTSLQVLALGFNILTKHPDSKTKDIIEKLKKNGVKIITK